MERQGIRLLKFVVVCGAGNIFGTSVTSTSSFGVSWVAVTPAQLQAATGNISVSFQVDGTTGDSAIEVCCGLRCWQYFRHFRNFNKFFWSKLGGGDPRSITSGNGQYI